MKGSKRGGHSRRLRPELGRGFLILIFLAPCREKRWIKHCGSPCWKARVSGRDQGDEADAKALLLPVVQRKRPAQRRRRHLKDGRGGGGFGREGEEGRESPVACWPVECKRLIGQGHDYQGSRHDYRIEA